MLLAAAGGAFADTRSATLVWELGGDPTATGTFLYWGKVQDEPLAPPTRIDLPGNVTNHVVTNLVDDTTYYFYVTAYNREGLESAPSNRAIFRAQQTTAPQAEEVNLSLLTTNNLVSDALSFDLVGGQPEKGSGYVFCSSSTSRVYCPPAAAEVAALRYRFNETSDPDNPTDALVRIYVDPPNSGAPLATPPSGPVLVTPGSTVDIPLVGRGASGEQLVASRVDDSSIPAQLLSNINYGFGLLRFTAPADYFGQFSFAYNVLSADGSTESPFATVLVQVAPTPALAAITMVDGMPQLGLRGPLKAIYNIHRSPDLVNWEYQATVVTMNGLTVSVPFLDAHTSAVPAAFYRTQFAGYLP